MKYDQNLARQLISIAVQAGTTEGLIPEFRSSAIVKIDVPEQHIQAIFTGWYAMIAVVEVLFENYPVASGHLLVDREEIKIWDWYYTSSKILQLLPTGISSVIPSTKKRPTLGALEGILAMKRGAQLPLHGLG